jgi:hypothetical protein
MGNRNALDVVFVTLDFIVLVFKPARPSRLLILPLENRRKSVKAVNTSRNEEIPI